MTAAAKLANPLYVPPVIITKPKKKTPVASMVVKKNLQIHAWQVQAPCAITEAGNERVKKTSAIRNEKIVQNKSAKNATRDTASVGNAVPSPFSLLEAPPVPAG